MSHLVSVQWLHKNLSNTTLIVLDASMPKATTLSTTQQIETIPTALFFDITNTFSNTSSPFPNTIPNTQQFEQEAQKLGISSTSNIIVFDNLGVYSSPRVWWLFKTFGHHNVFVLNGGLAEWKLNNFKTVKNYSKPIGLGNFKSVYQPHKVIFFKDLKHLITNKNVSIIDARSSKRFNSEVPEPREGLKSGCIPNSVNLPYQMVLENGLFKSKTELQNLFKSLTKRTQLVFTCGSGVTAAILDIAAQEAGYQTTSVYDGSWTEYGTLQ